MYWLNSGLVITCDADLDFLISLYREVRGELTFKNQQNVVKIEWTTNPFLFLKKYLESNTIIITQDSHIECRLCGPDTIKAVSFTPKKFTLDEVSAFSHTKKAILLWWADRIDEILLDEMDRRNDLLQIWDKPSEDKRVTMAELCWAIKLSENATYFIPCETGFLVSNEKSGYLSYFGIMSKTEMNTSLMFDKDDGFCSPFSKVDLSFLNSKFLSWKNDNHKGKLSDHFDSTYTS